MFPLLFFPFACAFPLSSVVLFPCLWRFSLALFCTVCAFFLLAFCCTVFYDFIVLAHFPFSLFVCLLFVVCFDNPPFPSILLLFFPVVVLFCCPIKTGRNGPIKNPDNGRKSANQREVEGPIRERFCVPIRKTPARGNSKKEGTRAVPCLGSVGTPVS